MPAAAGSPLYELQFLEEEEAGGGNRTPVICLEGTLRVFLYKSVFPTEKPLP